MTSRLARTAAATATLALLTGGFALAAPASADDNLNITYDATGSTLVAKPKSTIKLGPTTLTSTIRPDGTFTGALPIPSAQSAFNVIGFIPAKATVSFLSTGPVTGALVSDPNTGSLRVQAVAKYTLKLTNVTLAGIPTFVGDKCLSSSVVSIPVATPAGKAFDIEAGGTVSGTYTIPSFANCGLTTGIINQLVPGPNNTVSFALSNGRISS